MINYGNTIANLSCSVMKYFGVKDIPNNTLELADGILNKEYKNIVLMIIDGMGSEIMRTNLEENSFLNRHKVADYSSVFPPTTVAATTAAESGLYPNQSGWLGWTCYYKELNKNVVVFRNLEDETDLPVADFNAANRYFGYEKVVDKVKKAGFSAYSVSPFGDVPSNTFDEVCENIIKLSNEDGRKYFYSYWSEPDGTMHATGCHSEQSVSTLRDIEQKIEKLSDELSDTLIIVTADHGHIDNRNDCILEYPKLMEMIVRLPSIEPRCLNLFVKEGRLKEFEAEFNKEFSQDFILMSKAEVISSKLFGTGENHPRFNELLGDFLAVAKGDLSIFNTMEDKGRFIGVHAGITEEEMIIPLIKIEH